MLICADQPARLRGPRVIKVNRSIVAESYRDRTPARATVGSDAMMRASGDAAF